MLQTSQERGKATLNTVSFNKTINNNIFQSSKKIFLQKSILLLVVKKYLKIIIVFIPKILKLLKLNTN